MTLGKLTIVLWAVVVVVAAVLPAAAAANKPSSPPTIDLQARCKRTQDAVVDMMGDPSLRATALTPA